MGRIAQAIPDVRFEPERYFAAILKLRERNGTALLNRSGKTILVGLKREEDLPPAVFEVTSRLRPLGYDCEPSVPDIQNIVANFRVHFQHSLETLALALLSENLSCEYEPEQFPGIIARFSDSRATFLLFGTGRITVTGAKSVSDLKMLTDRLVDALRGCGALR